MFGLVCRLWLVVCSLDFSSAASLRLLVFQVQGYFRRYVASKGKPWHYYHNSAFFYNFGRVKAYPVTDYMDVLSSQEL